MEIRDIPVPQAYKNSADFRFFMDWIATCYSQIQQDIENMTDLLDPQRCPTDLLWMLADTIGFKYDDRMIPAYNRLVMLYFMSMIYNRGSQTGVTLAAEINLAQFNLNNYAEEDSIHVDRLDDTSIPVNSVYVTGHTAEGYIDIVYYSEKIPVDACLEYVRPLGMYCFTNAGVRVDARTKVSVDARLTNSNNMRMSVGPTRVGHYRRADYASLQPMVNNEGQPDIKGRDKAYYRNRSYEHDPTVNAGLRSLDSLQLCNNEHIVKSLIPETIFYLGDKRSDINVVNPETYYKDKDKQFFNLLYDNDAESTYNGQIYTIDEDRTIDGDNPRPAVNPPMLTVGSAMSMNSMNTSYTYTKDDETIGVRDINEQSEETDDQTDEQTEETDNQENSENSEP